MEKDRPPAPSSGSGIAVLPSWGGRALPLSAGKRSAPRAHQKRCRAAGISGAVRASLQPPLRGSLLQWNQSWDWQPPFSGVRLLKGKLRISPVLRKGFVQRHYSLGSPLRCTFRLIVKETVSDPRPESRRLQGMRTDLSSVKRHLLSLEIQGQSRGKTTVSEEPRARSQLCPSHPW